MIIALSVYLLGLIFLIDRYRREINTQALQKAVTWVGIAFLLWGIMSLAGVLFSITKPSVALRLELFSNGVVMVAMALSIFHLTGCIIPEGLRKKASVKEPSKGKPTTSPAEAKPLKTSEAKDPQPLNVVEVDKNELA